MVSRTHLVLKATERSYLALLKREIHILAISAGFSERKVGEIDIVVAELGTNLVNHGGGGKMLVKLIMDNDMPGIEIISLDTGVGMADVNRMMTDGVSSKNTLGQGLGAIKRLSDSFQIYSLQNWGTVTLVRFFKEELPLHRKKELFDIRSVLVPKTGEVKCGDGFYSRINKDRVILFLGDGLGHGIHAEEAVLAAIDSIKNSYSSDPVEIIRGMHADVKKTRGLVGTVAVFDIKARTWSICGVGNILTKINSHANQLGFLPYNGIIGLNIPSSLKERTFAYEPGQYLVMCSDGIKSRFDLNKHTAVQRYDPTIMAASIINEFNRHTDDVGVVVCKINL